MAVTPAVTLSSPGHLFNCSSEAFQKGGRKGAKRVMIVITDGESHDSPDLEKVIEDSEKDNVTRYAVAVSSGVLQDSSVHGKKTPDLHIPTSTPGVGLL